MTSIIPLVLGAVAVLIEVVVFFLLRLPLLAFILFAFLTVLVAVSIWFNDRYRILENLTRVPEIVPNQRYMRVIFHRILYNMGIYYSFGDIIEEDYNKYVGASGKEATKVGYVIFKEKFTGNIIVACLDYPDKTISVRLTKRGEIESSSFDGLDEKIASFGSPKVFEYRESLRSKLDKALESMARNKRELLIRTTEKPSGDIIREPVIHAKDYVKEEGVELGG